MYCTMQMFKDSDFLKTALRPRVACPATCRLPAPLSPHVTLDPLQQGCLLVHQFCSVCSLVNANPSSPFRTFSRARKKSTSDLYRSERYRSRLGHRPALRHLRARLSLVTTTHKVGLIQYNIYQELASDFSLLLWKMPAQEPRHLSVPEVAKINGVFMMNPLLSCQPQLQVGLL